MTDAPLLIFLDDYHLGDPLFVDGLAQRMGRSPARPRCLLVHGGGEEAVRALEGEGLFPEMQDGVPTVAGGAGAAVVERAVRQLNRTIVGTLTDAGVPAVGVHGADRGLLRPGADGRIEAGRAGWLHALVAQGGVPVVSALVEPAAGPWRLAPPAQVVRALAESGAEHGLAVVLLARSGTPGGAGTAALTLREALAAGTPEAGVARAALEGGVEVWLSSPGGLFGGGGRQGTRLLPLEPA
ncbi:MAG: acetylglutamate kinase [Rhodothermales bacterium]|nr:acetylglutamate kinase [Rhodothermales bacterium]